MPGEENMNQEPPDIETCKDIINSADLLAGGSIRGGLGRLAVAGLFLLSAFWGRDVQWVNDWPYFNVRGTFSLGTAIFMIRQAYLRVYGAKDGRILVWFAKDYLSRHIQETARQNAECEKKKRQQGTF